MINSNGHSTLAHETAQAAATALGRSPAEPGTTRLAEALDADNPPSVWGINSENALAERIRLAQQVARAAHVEMHIAVGAMERGAEKWPEMQLVRRHAHRHARTAEALMATLTRLEDFGTYISDMRRAGWDAIDSEGDVRSIGQVAEAFASGKPAAVVGAAWADLERGDNDHEDGPEDDDLTDGMNDD